MEKEMRGMIESINRMGKFKVVVNEYGDITVYDDKGNMLSFFCDEQDFLDWWIDFGG